MGLLYASRAFQWRTIPQVISAIAEPQQSIGVVHDSIQCADREKRTLRMDRYHEKKINGCNANDIGAMGWTGCDQADQL